MPRLIKGGDAAPATIGLVKECRSELRADIQATRHELKKEITELRGELRSGFHAVNEKIERVLMAVHRSQVIAEEQKADNRIVLDGLNNLNEKFDRLKSNHIDLRRTVDEIRGILPRA